MAIKTIVAIPLYIIFIAQTNVSLVKAIILIFKAQREAVFKYTKLLSNHFIIRFFYKIDSQAAFF